MRKMIAILVLVGLLGASGVAVVSAQSTSTTSTPAVGSTPVPCVIHLAPRQIGLRITPRFVVDGVVLHIAARIRTREACELSASATVGATLRLADGSTASVDLTRGGADGRLWRGTLTVPQNAKRHLANVTIKVTDGARSGSHTELVFVLGAK